MSQPKDTVVTTKDKFQRRASIDWGGPNSLVTLSALLPRKRSAPIGKPAFADPAKTNHLTTHQQCPVYTPIPPQALFICSFGTKLAMSTHVSYVWSCISRGPRSGLMVDYSRFDHIDTSDSATWPCICFGCRCSAALQTA